MKGTLSALVVGAVIGLTVLAVVDRTPTVYIGSPIEPATFVEPTSVDFTVDTCVAPTDGCLIVGPPRDDLDAAFEELDQMGKEMDELFEGLERLQELMELEATGKLWSA